MYTWLSPWSVEAVAVALADAVIQGPGWSPELREYGLVGGLRAIYRWNQAPRYPNEVDRARWEAKRNTRLERFGRSAESEFPVPPWDEWAEQPLRKPAFTKVFRDDGGRLWVLLEDGTLGIYEGLPPTTTRPPQEWLVLDAEGFAVLRVTTPPAFDLMTVWGDRAIGVVTDELDVQRVVAYELPDGSSGSRGSMPTTPGS